MLKKKENVISSKEAHSVLSAGLMIKGDMSADNDVRIDGTLEGNISCKGKVIIGIDGLVNGNLDCRNVELNGKIYGNVIIHETFVLRSTSFFKGEVNAKILEVDPGAQFCGTCIMPEDNKGVALKNSTENTDKKK